MHEWLRAGHYRGIKVPAYDYGTEHLARCSQHIHLVRSCEFVTA